MIDIHNHILFNIDDGAHDLDTSVEMCRDAYENGYNTVVVTPHFTDEEKATPENKVEEKVEVAQEND